MNAVDTTFQAALAITGRLTNTSTWETGARQWSSGEQQTLICCRVTDETHDVKTFEFCTADGIPVRFEPGQFMTILANVAGQSTERCYTISSPPTRPFLVSITVKRVAGGVMSNWLHDTMQPGRQLSAYGPSGAFTTTVSPAPKTLYLSAGSGITPLMSMTRASIDLGLDHDIAFVHSARTPADIIFREELQRLAKLSSQLKLFFVCEDVSNETEWSGVPGRLNLEQLKQWLPDYAEREVFTCGPAGYMSAVRDLLREGGHDPRQYHQESFAISSGAAQESQTFEPAVTQEVFTVTLSRSSKTFTMNASETVLGAAKKAGVPIPSSCSQGVCGTCKTKILEGSVDMKHNGGIRAREVAKGFRLLCCSRPTSDLVLEL